MSATTASHGFLGEEFLTWLWFRLETDGGEFDLGNGRVVGVSVDDFIQFAPRDDDETEQMLRNGTPTRSPEAAAGLRSGRRLRRARLVVALGDLTWRLSIDGETFGLHGIRLPDDDPDSTSAEDRTRDRAANFLLIHQIVVQIYRQFLGLRLRPEYLANEAREQAEWRRTRGRGRGAARS